jgi:hypothetical protein
MQALLELLPRDAQVVHVPGDDDARAAGYVLRESLQTPPDDDLGLLPLLGKDLPGAITLQASDEPSPPMSAPTEPARSIRIVGDATGPAPAGGLKALPSQAVPLEVRPRPARLGRISRDLEKHASYASQAGRRRFDPDRPLSLKVLAPQGLSSFLG